MKVKYIIFLMFWLMFVLTKTFSQGSNYSYYSVGVKFLLGKTKIDPVIIDIFEQTLPKIINQDIEGSVAAFTGVLCEKKGIKELNPNFTKYVTNRIIYLTKVFPKNDYFEITMSMADLILVTDNFLNKNIVPDNTFLNTNKMAYSIVDTASINKSYEAVKIDHKTIIEKLQGINDEKKNISCIAFTSFGGYVILYGKNGYYFKGIPKNASEKLHQLNDAKKEIKQIAFNPTGGYIILYGKNGYSTKSTSKEITDELSRLNQSGNSIDLITFSPSGGYVIIYDKYGFVCNNVPPSCSEKLASINEKQLEIKSIAFEEDDGYVIIYGKNGFFSSQIPKTTSEKLKELHDNNKTIDYISFITGGGHVIIYNSYAYSYRGVK